MKTGPLGARTLVGAALSGVLLFAESPAPGQDAKSKNNAATQTAQQRVLNVRDFGAVGDGKHDDTKALQAAFDAAVPKAPRQSKRGKAMAVYYPVKLYM